MRNHKRYILAAMGLMWAAAMNAELRAQIHFPFGPEAYEHDFQLFAPFELDLNNEPVVDDYGYFFNWSKLAWSFNGERVPIGDPDVTVFAEVIYRDNPNDQGDPPPPYQVLNGIQDGGPNAGFGWGDRYEIGYRHDGDGWTFGILDGPKQRQTVTHGLSDALDGDALPPIDPDYVGPAPGPFFALGFGSVHVNFDTPEGYLLGFRDYLNFLAGAATGTQVGPIVYVGNYGGTAEGDPGDDEGEFEFVRLTDDIDEDGIIGADIIVVIGPDGVPRLTTITDFDDLHQFNIRFDQLQVRNDTSTSGVELMWTHQLSTSHYMAKHQNNHLELGVGVRYYEIDDFFGVTGDGDILGRTYWNTNLVNHIVGPQFSVKWVNQRARWRISADTRVVLGYNFQDWSQQNGIGEQLVPGAVNRLLYAQPTYSAHGLTLGNFAPMGELRVQTAYYLTQSFALKAGYTGSYVGGIRRASTSVRYYLPDMGFRDSGTQDFIVNGLDLGVEFVY